MTELHNLHWLRNIVVVIKAHINERDGANNNAH